MTDKTGRRATEDDDHKGGALRRLGVLALFFIVGGIFCALQLPPMTFILQGFSDTRTLIAEAMQSRNELLAPARHEGNGVTRHDPGRAAGGLTVVQGLLPGGPQLRLLDMDGREINRWDVDFFAAWPDPAHIVPAENTPKSRLHYHTQGFHVLPDGSALVNVGDKGAFMMDRCGKVLWTVDRMTHHSVTPDGTGGYWLPAHMPLNEIPDRLLSPFLSREELAGRMVGRWDNPVNTLIRVDENGDVVEEFVVLDALAGAGLESILHDGWSKRITDPTHLNDIEVVTPALAGRIAGVEAGDLLISLRTLNMLAILDRETGALLWHKRGPWIRQHDPDIAADGTIVLFNNRLEPRNNTDGFTGSQILRYDPATDVAEVLHPTGQQDRFYAHIMGAHQTLANGNGLIVETTAGRIIEATPGGDVVWEFILNHDDGFAALIEGAARLPQNYFKVSDWSCPTGGAATN